MFDFVTLTLKFDLLVKNFNLGCYLMILATPLLSSDNSYFEGFYNILVGFSLFFKLLHVAIKSANSTFNLVR